MGINYGFDTVRFVTPVKSGARVRGRFTLAEARFRGAAMLMTTYDVTVDIENEKSRRSPPAGPPSASSTRKTGQKTPEIWLGRNRMHDEAVRNAFLVQAKACDSLGSPFTARLCRAVAARLDRQTEVGETILSWPGDVGPSGDSVPLRLAGRCTRSPFKKRSRHLSIFRLMTRRRCGRPAPAPCGSIRSLSSKR